MARMHDLREYRLKPEALEEARRLAIKRYILPQFAVLAGAVIVSFFLAVRSAKGSVVGFVVVLLLFLGYIVFWGPRRLLRRQAKCWETYVLTIGPDYLLRQQADTPEIRLPFSSVKCIEHLPGRYLRVIGTEKYQVIGIPASVENFGEILNAVSQIAPSTNLKRDRSIRNVALLACGFGAYTVMLWTPSPKVALPFALIVSGLLIWLVVYTQRSPNVALKNKRVSWFYLAFLMISILKALDAFSRLRSR
jgi:hypothetical protein